MTLCYGVNPNTNEKIFLDRKSLAHPGALIVGRPGCGMNYFIKREVIQVTEMTDDEIIYMEAVESKTSPKETIRVALGRDDKTFIAPPGESLVYVIDEIRSNKMAGKDTWVYIKGADMFLSGFYKDMIPELLASGGIVTLLVTRLLRDDDTYALCFRSVGITTYLSMPCMDREECQKAGPLTEKGKEIIKDAMPGRGVMYVEGKEIPFTLRPVT